MKIYLITLLLFTLKISVMYSQPNKIWATYLGGNDANSPLGTRTTDIIYDLEGYIYVGGITADNNMATPNSFKLNMDGSFQSYLAKFDTLGNRIWATYISNGGTSALPHITLDNSGNVLVAGMTNGDQNYIGTPGTYAPEIPNATQNYSYVIKFDSDGNRIWGTYLESENFLTNNTTFKVDAIVTDYLGNVLIGGSIPESNVSFPASNAYMVAPLNSVSHAFLIKLSSNGEFVWGTYYGEEGSSVTSYLACDPSGNIYMVGGTNSSVGIATFNTAFPNKNLNVPEESFITKFNPDGSRDWGTYTNGIEVRGGIALKDSIFYLAGTTIQDTGIATLGTYQYSYSDSIDFCVTKWNTSGLKIWGTYYGDIGEEYYNGWTSPFLGVNEYVKTHSISIDGEENIIIVGGTSSLDNIKIGCTYTGNGKEDSIVQNGNGFIAKFYPDGNIMWGSYYDMPLSAVAGNNYNSFYLVAETDIQNLSTSGAFQEEKSIGISSGFISKMTGNYICPELNLNIHDNNNVLSVDSNYFSYQWYRNDEPITNADSYQLNAIESGIYYVRFKNSCDCIYTSDSISIEGTGIGKVYNNDLNITLFPNPTSGKFLVRGTLRKRNQKIEYFITDITGKKLKESSFFSKGQEFTYECNVNHFSSGIYFLKIQSEEGWSVMKFVKED